MLRAVNHPESPDEVRRVPHNIQAEQSLLGAILVDNRAFERVSEIIAPRDFFDPLHARIFEITTTLIQSGRLVSPISLKTFFENADPTYTGMTVIQYLGTLASCATTVSGARDYALTIRELSALRDLILIGEDLSNSATEADAEKASSGIIEDAEARLFELAEKSSTSKGGTVSFSNAAHGSIERTMKAFKRGGSLGGLSTGLVDLDAKLGGLQRSDLIILAGRPSMGKTALATNIAYNVARSKIIDDDGVEKPAPVGFFSLEMSSEQLATRIISSETSIASHKLTRGLVSDAELKAISAKALTIKSTPLYIDDRGGITIGQLMARARRVKRQYGIELLVVDYLQLLSGTKKERVQELTQITTGLKTLAKELNIPVIALSQLSRANEKREDKRPQLSDLRESGSIEQDADVVVFVFREEYYIEREKPEMGDQAKFREWQQKMAKASGKAEAIIGKQRHGPVGIVDLAFQGDFTRFSNLSQGDSA